MVKPRSKQAKVKATIEVDDQAIAALADQMADRPYEAEMPPKEPIKSLEERLEGLFEKSENIEKQEESQADPETEELERITISLPQAMRYQLEDMARDRKRAKKPGRSVSAIVREALERYLQ